MNQLHTQGQKPKHLMHEWIVIQSEDKNTGFGMNCPCNSFTTEVILSIVQMFDKGVDAKCSECESYLRTQVVHLYMKLPCESVSVQMPPPSCTLEMSVPWGIGSALISACSQQLWAPYMQLSGVRACIVSLSWKRPASPGWLHRFVVSSAALRSRNQISGIKPLRWYIYHIILICLSVGCVSS